MHSGGKEHHDFHIGHNVHRVLAHSYIFYLILFLVGVALDLAFKPKIFSNPNIAIIGGVFLVLASALIFWAQSTSRNLDVKNVSKETFCKGPYCYTRTPTHWGLFILMLGFGILTNALFVIITTLISFFVTKTVFLRKQENMLEYKYGAPYAEYRRSVRL